MGSDMPDGTRGMGRVGYDALFHQYAVPFSSGQAVEIAAGQGAVIGYTNPSDTHLVRIRGWRALCFDRTNFTVYLYYNVQGFGYYIVNGQYECLYNSIDSFLLGYNDYFKANCINDDASARTLRFYVLGERFLKPAGWIRRPNCSWTVDDSTPAVDQVLEFTDDSLYSPTEWSWNFGDGVYSTEQNPTHAYAAAGAYTVTLIVRNAGGVDVHSATLTVT